MSKALKNFLLKKRSRSWSLVISHKGLFLRTKNIFQMRFYSLCLDNIQINFMLLLCFLFFFFPWYNQCASVYSLKALEVLPVFTSTWREKHQKRKPFLFSYYLSPSFPRFVNELYMRVPKGVLKIIHERSFIGFIELYMSYKVLYTSFWLDARIPNMIPPALDIFQYGL